VKTIDVSERVNAVWVNVDEENDCAFIVEETDRGDTDGVSIQAHQIRPLIEALEEAARLLGA